MPSSTNRRAFERSNTEAYVLISEDDTSHYKEAWSVNFSVDGMFFLLDQPMKKGTNVNVEALMPSTDMFGNEACMGFRAEVVRCRKVRSKSPAQYGIGVQFSEPISLPGYFCYVPVVD